MYRVLALLLVYCSTAGHGCSRRCSTGARRSCRAVARAPCRALPTCGRAVASTCRAVAHIGAKRAPRLPLGWSSTAGRSPSGCPSTSPRRSRRGVARGLRRGLPACGRGSPEGQSRTRIAPGLPRLAGRIVDLRGWMEAGCYPPPGSPYPPSIHPDAASIDPAMGGQSPGSTDLAGWSRPGSRPPIGHPRRSFRPPLRPPSLCPYAPTVGLTQVCQPTDNRRSQV